MTRQQATPEDSADQTKISECSAKVNRGVNEAFAEAARVAIKNPPSKKKKKGEGKSGKESLGGKCLVM